MSKIEVNAIEPQCGTNLTVGASGDTITFPSGTTVVNNGSQTGFGRTGTVDWDTTAKTASFTAVSGVGYFVNTTSGAITVTLPASPNAGDIIAVSDYAQNASTNNITLARNGSNIQGDASDLVIQKTGVAMTLVFVDATKGWIVTNAGSESDKDPTAEFIVASGGTETECGDYKIHTFTTPGTFTVSGVGNSVGSNTVDYMVVAGGGGAGSNSAASSISGGGGGGGGYRESSGTASGSYTIGLPANSCTPALPVSVQGYPITVGAGGAGGLVASTLNGSNGGNSIFSTIISAGGGFGMGRSFTPIGGGPGGSGGGTTGNVPGTGGTGNTPPVSPPQGNNGGNNSGADNSNIYGSAGGGGAGAAANPVDTPPDYGATDGGDGVTTFIKGTPNSRSGGGGGGGANAQASPLTTTNAGGSGGSGGGGAGGSSVCAVQGANGTTNTGGGGGSPGAGLISGIGRNGGSGGSGIVIIRYKFQ